MPTVVLIWLRGGTNTFTSTKFDRDFRYGTINGRLLVIWTVQPAEDTKHTILQPFSALPCIIDTFPP